MEIKFGVIDLMDHNDRLYIAVWGDYEFEFEFVAQFTGTTGDAYMHNGLKNPDDPKGDFTESPAWNRFEAATGVTPEAFLRAFEEFINEAVKADED